jgi:hypothetical protein
MTNIALQYVQDENGVVSAVQIPVSDWEKLLDELRSYEQMLHLKADLTLAFAQVRQIRNKKMPGKALIEALDEL